MLYLREVLKAAELEPEELVPGIGDDVKVMSIHYLRFFNFPSFNMLNTKRGRLKKEENQPEFHIIGDESPGGLNRSWARLIKKIYEVDPLVCPRCGGDMRVIAFIEDYRIVKKILDYYDF